MNNKLINVTRKITCSKSKIIVDPKILHDCELIRKEIYEFKKNKIKYSYSNDTFLLEELRNYLINNIAIIVGEYFDIYDFVPSYIIPKYNINILDMQIYNNEIYLFHDNGNICIYDIHTKLLIREFKINSDNKGIINIISNINKQKIYVFSNDILLIYSINNFGVNKITTLPIMSFYRNSTLKLYSTQTHDNIFINAYSSYVLSINNENT